LYAQATVTLLVESVQAMEFAFNRRPRPAADDSYESICRSTRLLQNLVALSIGAVLGALSRFAITHYSSELSHHHGFPYGTLIVNFTGSFLAAFVLAYTTRDAHDDIVRIALVTGFCGAYTTFSAFAFESVQYLQQRALMQFAANVLLNNVLALSAALAGIVLAQRR
jgi:CrcB protein